MSGSGFLKQQNKNIRQVGNQANDDPCRYQIGRASIQTSNQQPRFRFETAARSFLFLLDPINYACGGSPRLSLSLQYFRLGNFRIMSSNTKEFGHLYMALPDFSLPRYYALKTRQKGQEVVLEER